jgi:hypothetical protein
VTSYDGHSLTFTIDQSNEGTLVTGKTYRVKYRAVNAVGASSFTGTTSIAMADLPGKSNIPTRVDSLSDETRIVLQWTPPTSADSPGGDIIGYRLEVDDGLGGNFTIVYDSSNTASLT